jgi:integrase
MKTPGSILEVDSRQLQGEETAGAAVVTTRSGSAASPGRQPLHAVSPSTSPEWASTWEGFELYLMSLQRSPLTIANRKSTVSVLARHMTAKGIQPASVTKAILGKWLLAEYKDRKPGGQGALYTNLVVFWAWYSAEYGTPDPMKGIPRPKGKTPSVAVVTPEDFAKVLQACGSDTTSPAIRQRNTAIVWLMVESGLRRFEVCALDLADVDLKQRTVTVRCGKNGKARVSVFGSQTASEVWRYVTKYRGQDPGPLFQSAMGGHRLTTSGMTQVIAGIKERSGVQVRPHLFRHTWCDAQLNNGTPESVVMTLAGWSSSDMLRRYGARNAQERAIVIGRAFQVGQVMKARS